MKSVLNLQITPLRLALAVLLFGAAAFAAGTIAIDYNERWTQGGITVGSSYSSTKAGATTASSNRITAMPGCECDEDVPSIPTGYWKVGPNTCTCTGVKVGDPCIVGALAATPADAGSGWYNGMEIQAIARGPNLVELQFYNQLGDAGALDPPDAGYLVNCFSRQ